MLYSIYPKGTSPEDRRIRRGPVFEVTAPEQKGEDEMGINRVLISGNLTRDPELRSTAGGTSVLGFGVAVNDRRRNASTGEWEDYANFVDCTMFGARAEGISRYLSKGTKVCIEGKLRWSQWESKDGTGKRSKLEVIVDEIEFVGLRASDRERIGDGEGHEEPIESEPPAFDVYDEDVPF